MKAKAGTILIELSREEAEYICSLTFRDWVGELDPTEPEPEKRKAIREDIYKQVYKVLEVGK